MEVQWFILRKTIVFQGFRGVPSFSKRGELFSGGGGSKIVSEYDQEIPQSQTADNPVAPRGRAAQPSRDTRKIN